MSQRELLERLNAIESKYNAEINELRREVARLKHIVEAKAPAANPNAGALVTRDNVKKMIAASMGEIIPFTTEQAVLACREEFTPQITNLTKRLNQTATYISYKLSETETETRDYLTAVLKEDDRAAGNNTKRIGAKGAVSSRRDIIPGGVSLAFDYEEHVS